MNFQINLRKYILKSKIECYQRVTKNQKQTNKKTHQDQFHKWIILNLERKNYFTTKTFAEHKESFQILLTKPEKLIPKTQQKYYNRVSRKGSHINTNVKYYIKYLQKQINRLLKEW